ncbi:BA75_02629T0 [Komagataella pastoris]|uniref:BA75_02629T0 n=1 Tax=Komagataella pastoris TaxID=4922 RepID=A0A1B2JAP4_PICPA|nr:BA75_02629T0 [Komagataella pastoris]
MSFQLHELKYRFRRLKIEFHHRVWNNNDNNRLISGRILNQPFTSLRTDQYLDVNELKRAQIQPIEERLDEVKDEDEEEDSVDRDGDVDQLSLVIVDGLDEVDMLDRLLLEEEQAPTEVPGQSEPYLLRGDQKSDRILSLLDMDNLQNIRSSVSRALTDHDPIVNRIKSFSDYLFRRSQQPKGSWKIVLNEASLNAALCSTGNTPSPIERTHILPDLTNLCYTPKFRVCPALNAKSPIPQLFEGDGYSAGIFEEYIDHISISTTSPNNDNNRTFSKFPDQQPSTLSPKSSLIIPHHPKPAMTSNTFYDSFILQNIEYNTVKSLRTLFKGSTLGLKENGKFQGTN